ncbi:MAG: hypothetical protein COB46_12080 [Rhodospirillaceae bacterium]|nr:MAG: hypothetical protein COB46_12080 [Rhodospirillaceae bacterium]
MADQQSIVIKKIKKTGGASHGGAWKIAYADFVTAMMAFFLLLWLLSSASQEQLEGISDYFAPTTASVSQSGSGEILGGKTIAVDGAMEDTVSRPQVTMDLPPPKAGSGGEAMQDEPVTAEQEAVEAKKEAENDQFKEAKDALDEAMATLPEFQQLAKSLMVEDTPEGLRIQIVDQDGLAMFTSGQAVLLEHTQKVIALVAGIVAKMPQDIAISGHTDSVPMAGHDYTNWELSSDRANAARRFAIKSGIPVDRITSVSGKAATQPLLPDDPTNARNRRLSIVLLRGTGDQVDPNAPREPPPSIINSE